MDQVTQHRSNESTGRGATWLMALALIGFALLMFRQILAPDCCLFSTDDNIGSVAGSKSILPQAFFGAWGDTPYLGNGGKFMPHSWAYLLVWLLPVKMYINWVHALDLIIASFFSVLFMREQKAGWASIALGLLTAFWLGSNLTLTYAGHLGKYGVLMLASVALYCISRALARQPSLLWGILAGGAIGFMFLEQPDVALFFGFILGAYALFLAVRQGRANGTWVKSAIALSLMGGIGLLISASSTLSSYAFNVKGAVSMQTESPKANWDFATQWSWPPDECIDFIAPGYMGWRSGEPAGPYWGRMGRSAGWEQTRQGFMNFKLENQYLGAIPILLALFAVLMATAGIRNRNDPRNTPNDTEDAERRAEIIFWGCVAVVTLLLAFGKFFPLYALFYKLPMVSSIRNPNKFLHIFQLALGILAAYGLDGLLCRWKGKIRM
ncbi:MAG: hypothetical protein L6455_01650 [Kiritimatiellae bacterium]|nr:hypothetical protein [Verrucomicrobiota bacterium]MBU4291500.1 hypothetical protein [Verrucomicrobiota bacterium]MCG2678667.1 hypothetical protein [Kiritimatiellia bacterium]